METSVAEVTGGRFLKQLLSSFVSKSLIDSGGGLGQTESSFLNK